MTKPTDNPEFGVLLTLGIIIMSTILMLILVIGSLWPRITAFFNYV